MRIGLLSGAYPPAVDGIGDYTQLLARELGSHLATTVFTSRQASYSADDGVSVCGVFDPRKPSSIKNLFEAATTGPALDRLVVQYNPFGFGPRGFNPWLPRTLARLRKKIPLSVMFHETYVPAESAAQIAMRLWQIPQFAALCRIPDSLYTSCTRWLPAIRRASGREAIHLPVGSNVGLSKLSRETARDILGIENRTLVLGIFGSAHPSRLLDWISLAAKTLRSSHPDLLVLYIGADGEKLRSELGPDIPLLDCGLLAAETVGDRLMAADLFLAPFVDGLSTRRGSVAAAFQHGIPVISTSSCWTDALLLAQKDLPIFLSPVGEGAGAFASLAVKVSEHLPFPESRRIGLGNFYEQNFGWTPVARRLMEGMEDRSST